MKISVLISNREAQLDAAIRENTRQGQWNDPARLSY
jgi:hypothetical protein